MAAMAEARERRYLSRGQVMRVASEAAKRRLVYIEKKDGDIDGAAARIGWVAFLDGGLRAHYRGRTLTRAAEGSQGNYFDEARILNIAHRYQQATDWHRRAPAGVEGA